jgi:hypothetical protein
MPDTTAAIVQLLQANAELCVLIVEHQRRMATLRQELAQCRLLVALAMTPIPGEPPNLLRLFLPQRRQN